MTDAPGILHLLAFAAEPGGGNPAGVVLDATALDDDYASQQPAVVADELVAAAAVVADAFEAVPDDRLDRTGLRSDGSAFTVDSLARYFVHDPVHHLHDVRR